FGAVGGPTVVGDRGGEDRPVRSQLLAQSSRQVAHLLELRRPILKHPLPDLPGTKGGCPLRGEPRGQSGGIGIKQWQPMHGSERSAEGGDKRYRVSTAGRHVAFIVRRSTNG